MKCIYIDPPYNTGNEGWIYNDNLTQPQFKEWIGREVGKEGQRGHELQEGSRAAFQVLDEGDYTGEEWRDALDSLVRER